MEGYPSIITGYTDHKSVIVRGYYQRNDETEYILNFEDGTGKYRIKIVKKNLFKELERSEGWKDYSLKTHTFHEGNKTTFEETIVNLRLFSTNIIVEEVIKSEEKYQDLFSENEKLTSDYNNLLSENKTLITNEEELENDKKLLLEGKEHLLNKINILVNEKNDLCSKNNDSLEKIRIEKDEEIKKLRDENKKLKDENEELSGTMKKEEEIRIFASYIVRGQRNDDMRILPQTEFSESRDLAHEIPEIRTYSKILYHILIIVIVILLMVTLSNQEMRKNFIKSLNMN